MKLAVKYSVIMALSLLGWLSIAYLTGLHGSHLDLYGYFKYSILIIVGIIYYFGIREKKNRMKSKFEFMDGFSHGWNITEIGTLLNAGIVYFYTQVINKNVFDDFLQFSIIRGIENVERATIIYSFKNSIAYTLVISITIGLLLSTCFGVIFAQKRSK